MFNAVASKLEVVTLLRVARVWDNEVIKGREEDDLRFGVMKLE